jgi:hypothetical protein
MDKYVVVMNGISLTFPLQVNPNDLESVMKFVNTLKRDYPKSSLCIYEISRQLVHYTKARE